jgi:hypothetical protein
METLPGGTMNARTPDRELLSATNCTLYVKTWGGTVRKVRVKEVHISAGKYAQYDNAIKVRFKEPRQRKFRGYTESYQPFVLVVAGDGPEYDSWVAMKSSQPGVSVSKARYSFADKRWDSDAYALVKDAEVLFSSEGWNPHTYHADANAA